MFLRAHLACAASGAVTGGTLALFGVPAPLVVALALAVMAWAVLAPVRPAARG